MLSICIYLVCVPFTLDSLEALTLPPTMKFTCNSVCRISSKEQQVMSFVRAVQKPHKQKLFMHVLKLCIHTHTHFRLQWTADSYQVKENCKFIASMT